MVYVKSQCVYTTKSKIGSQLLLASTSSHVQLRRGSEKAFNECLGVSNVFPAAACYAVQAVTYHEVASIPLGEVNRERYHGSLGCWSELVFFSLSLAAALEVTPTRYSKVQGGEGQRFRWGLWNIRISSGLYDAPWWPNAKTFTYRPECTCLVIADDVATDSDGQALARENWSYTFQEKGLTYVRDWS